MVDSETESLPGCPGLVNDDDSDAETLSASFASLDNGHVPSSVVDLTKEPISTFNLQSAANVKRTDTELGEVKELETDFILPNPNKIPDVKPEQILSSLCISDSGTTMLNIPLSSPNTCSWILKHEKYVQWQTTRNSLLWIEAPSGYGKSVLAKYLVNEHKTTKSCYFFCDSNIKNRSNRRAILRTILYHMMSRHPELPSHAKLAYHKAGQDFVESLNTLIKIFKSCSKDPNLGDVVIIIDGLDECSDFLDSAFLEWITSTLQSETPNSLRFIVTSRPSSAATRVPSPAVIRLLLDTEAREDIGHDVHRFIDTAVSQIPNVQTWKIQDRSEFVNKLKARSNDTFLWASLFLRELQSNNELSLESARNLLTGTPQGVEGMYQRIFDKVSEGGRESLKFLLQMVIAAHNPLKVQELNWLHAVHKLGVQGELATADEGLDPNFQSFLRDLCGSVVTVVDGKVLLQHKSAKDFLIGSSGPHWYQFKELDAKVKIVQCCIWRLRSIQHYVKPQLRQDKSSFDSRLQSLLLVDQLDNFLEYTLSQWVNHFNDIQGSADQDMIQQVRLLYEDQAIFAIWQKSYWSWYIRNTKLKLETELQKLFTGVNPFPQDQLFIQVPELKSETSASMVRMASYVGHVRIFRALLDANPSLYHATFDDGWTSLCTAINKSQIDIVYSILRQDVDANTLCRGRVPLHYAAARSDPQLSQTLLDHGAEVDATSANQETALQHAAQLGHVQVVNTLLRADANSGLRDTTGKTALHHAAGNGHVSIVKLLLDGYANDGILDNRGRTSLALAAEEGQEGVVEMLLKTTRPDKIKEQHKFVLHGAMKSGKSTLIHMLLDVGLDDFQMKDTNGFTAFAYTLPTCDIRILKFFLEHGADLDERDPRGTTLLQRMASSDCFEGAKFLVENGANVHATTKDGRTALHFAVAGSGHEPIFRLLLDNGADIEGEDKSGHTPFHVAVLRWRSQTTLKILRSLSANIETKNHGGETPLQTAVRAQNAGLVQWLLLNGNARQDVISKEGFALHELARVSFTRNFDEIMVRDQDMLPYPIWSITQNPIPDDNRFQNFEGTMAAVITEKHRLIKAVLRYKGALKDGEIRPLNISFLPNNSEPSPALLDADREATGDVAGNSSKQASSPSQKQVGLERVTDTPAFIKNSKNEDKSMTEPVNVHGFGDTVEAITSTNPNDGESSKNVFLINSLGSLGREVIASVKLSNKKQESKTGCNCDEVQDVSDHEAPARELVSISHDVSQIPIVSTPFTKERDCDTLNRDESQYPRMTVSESTQGAAEETRHAATDASQRDPSDFVKSSASSTMEMRQSSQSSNNTASEAPQNSPPDCGESFLSDLDGSGSEDSDFTDSSDETAANFVPSLGQLGRAIAPELALGLEAARRAISEILWRLSATSATVLHEGEISSGAEGSGHPQSSYTSSISGRTTRTQNSGNGKAHEGNDGNIKRNNGDSDADNHEDKDNGGDGDGDGDGDDRNEAEHRTLSSDHCRCCRFRGDVLGSRPQSAVSMNVVGADVLKFACPFRKYNPKNHTWRSCIGPGWPTVHRVKAHIYLHHMLPIRCLRCGQSFDDDASLQTHSVQPVPCDPGEPEHFEGCSKEQEKKLKSRKRPREQKDLKEDDRWREMYRILFPNSPEISSPYHQVPHVDAAVVENITASFSQYFTNEFPKRFTDSCHSANVIDVGEIVVRHTNEILREYRRMELLSQEASQVCLVGARLEVPPRKRTCQGTVPATGDEISPTASQPAQSEFPSRLLDPTFALRSHSQPAPKNGSHSDAAVTSMSVPTHQSQWISAFVGASSASKTLSSSEAPTDENQHDSNIQSSALPSLAPQNGVRDFQELLIDFDGDKEGPQDFAPSFMQDDMSAHNDSSPLEPDATQPYSQALPSQDQFNFDWDAPTINGEGSIGGSGVNGFTDWHFLDNNASTMGTQNSDPRMEIDPTRTVYSDQPFQDLDSSS